MYKNNFLSLFSTSLLFVFRKGKQSILLKFAIAAYDFEVDTDAVTLACLLRLCHLLVELKTRDKELLDKPINI